MNLLFNMFQNENGLTASHWQAKSCFEQAIGEDTKGKLMDEIRSDAGLMILQITKARLDKVECKFIQTPPKEENLSIGIDSDPGATAKALEASYDSGFEI